MHHVTKLAILALSSALLAGCATNLSKQAAISSRADVFAPAAADSSNVTGKAGLNISASVKTHRQYSCPLDHASSHGTADYKLVVNIDGQAATLDGAPKQETLTDVAHSHPESGEGVRYTFRQRYALAPGEHRIVIALPDDGVAVERKIVVKDGENSLVIEPVYNQRSGGKKVMATNDFHEGIKSIKLTLNGSQVN